MDRLYFRIAIWAVLLCLDVKVALGFVPNFRTTEQNLGIFKQMEFDSLNVRFVGNWPFGPSYTVAYDSTRSLCFCGSGGGIYILDVSEPATPQKTSEIRTRGFVSGLFYEPSAQRLYIAGGFTGLEIWDVSMPSNPIKLGYYDTPGWTLNVTVSGSYAYVTDGGLWIFDVSTPSNPQEIGYYDTPGTVRDIAVSNPYAYIADESGGLRIIDISIPSDPQEVGYYDTPGMAKDVAVSGSYAYVAEVNAGLQIYENLLYGIEETKGTSGHNIRLLGNPLAHNYISLSLELSEKSKIDFAIFNITGQMVKSFPTRSLPSGYHKINLPVENLPSGIYFLETNYGSFHKSTKFLKLK